VGEFDDPVVEKRKPTLDPVGHGHTVSLARQDIAGQEEARLEILRLVQRMRAAEFVGKSGCKLLGGIVACQRRAKVAGIEDLRRGGVAQTRPVGEQRVVRPVATGSEKGGKIFGRLLFQTGQVWVKLAEQKRPDARARLPRAEATNPGFAEDVVAGK